MSCSDNTSPQNPVSQHPALTAQGCSAVSNRAPRKGATAGQQAASAASLGIKRQFPDIAENRGKERKAPDRQDVYQQQKKKAFSPEQRAERQKLERRAKFADQREAARIMWQHDQQGRPGGVTLCGWTKQAMADAVEVIRVTKPDVTPRSFLSGTAKCKLGWVCPICTAAKAETARQKLNAVLSKGRQVGWHMVMVTLTVRHDSDMPLEWLWPRLSAASELLRETYAWKQVNKRLVGSVKAVEATHGANGWHPHFHVVLVFKADAVADQAEAEGMAEGLRAEWMNQLAAQGLTGNDRAFQVQGAASAGNYLAKWGAAEEITLGHAKQGRKGQRSPWQLLRDSRDGDPDAGRLWYDFVTVIKGTHQIRITPGLNKEVKGELARLADAKADAIVAGKLKDEPETQVSLARFDDNAEWMERGRHRRVKMLEAAASRTRREAESAVWHARQGESTDVDLFRIELIEDFNEPTAAPHDEPELRLHEIRRKKMERRLASEQAWLDLEEIDFTNQFDACADGGG